MKRFNLNMSDDLYHELQNVAIRQDSDVTTVIKRFIKIGLFVESGKAKVVIENDSSKKEVVFI